MKQKPYAGLLTGLMPISIIFEILRPLFFVPNKKKRVPLGPPFLSIKRYRYISDLADNSEDTRVLSLMCGFETEKNPA